MKKTEKRKIAIGIQDFEEIITNNYFYIDKTSFIKEWWDCGDSVTLINRPRRFGKTLNMNMLEKFFSLEYAGRSDLFENLSVWNDEAYRQIQGTYPVISLTFASIKETNYEAAKMKIYQILIDLYEKNRFLLDEAALSGNEQSFFLSVNMEMPEYVATSAIHKLAAFLHKYYGKKVIILLDEYDTPMQEAYICGYWEELVAFTRSMFNAAFKTNPHLERGLMTGITRISKESIFSDLNNLEVVTTTSNKYETAFGFTEEEIFQALDEFGLSEEKESTKWWYDGFTFGEYTDIYNPWSALNLLEKRAYDTYWANTSSNRLVGKVIRQGGRQIKATFEQLLRGEVIRCPIDEQIVYNQLDRKESAIWSLLLASGYLKVLSHERMELLEKNKQPLYDLKLTNHEVERMFFSMIHDWFSDAEEDYNDFIQALLLNDIEAMNEYMNRVSQQMFSYFDTGKARSPEGSRREEPERFYHGFVLGLVTELSDQYRITSNRESGFGRYDVMLEPKNKDKAAYIFEFKVLNSRKEASLEETVQAALAQINEKNYEAVLLANGIAGSHIYKYGFAFEGKKVLIGEMNHKLT